MTDTLREILRAEPFAAVRAFDDLVRFHVWHSRMGVAEPADDAAREASSPTASTWSTSPCH